MEKLATGNDPTIFIGKHVWREHPNYFLTQQHTHGTTHLTPRATPRDAVMGDCQLEPSASVQVGNLQSHPAIGGF